MLRRPQPALPNHPGDPRMEQRYAFVLRIWLDESLTPRGQKVGTLRGTLQSVNASEPIYFNSLRQLNDLLEAALEQHDSATQSTTD
jgi:hypothetical protein